jgi:membrane-associated protease RseP (regulator of RpoE activity)
MTTSNTSEDSNLAPGVALAAILFVLAVLSFGTGIFVLGVVFALAGFILVHSVISRVRAKRSV